MSGGLYIRFIPLAVLLVFSAYFSGSEAAFFSLSSLEQDAVTRKSGHRVGSILAQFLASPDQVLITLLTGNMFVNVFAAAIAEGIGARLFPVDSELFSILAMTVLLLIVGEMVPKNVGVRYAPTVVRLTTRPLYYFYVVLKPLRWFFSLFNVLVDRLFPGRRAAEEEQRLGIIRSAVEIGYKEGILDLSELNLVETFCDFREKKAEEVMIPRTEIQGVDVTASIPSLLDGTARWTKAEGSSIMPVYDQDLDHLEGYIALRDLLPYKFGLKEGQRLGEIVRPALSVPATKSCADLLVEMRESNTEMAVVIDEYGGTAGIVTFKTLVEDLLGYFYPSQSSEIVEVAPQRYRVPGSLKIEDLEDLILERIPSESHTVSGLISERLGEIPAAGTRLTIGQVEFTVRRISKTRIVEVEIRKVQS